MRLLPKRWILILIQFISGYDEAICEKWDKKFNGNLSDI